MLFTKKQFVFEITNQLLLSFILYYYLVSVLMLNITIKFSFSDFLDYNSELSEPSTESGGEKGNSKKGNKRHTHQSKITTSKISIKNK